ncbi:hypothetical protein E2C01_059957 [Portunus trituberculatus]|uniref:Uncharacterized protein n=1 Tax=Portunus trituberculatus TaxID=210409 RepID=A0A5B7H411_PORTR|nr:hypothetical protein [Portunus trituberculatus]
MKIDNMAQGRGGGTCSHPHGHLPIPERHHATGLPYLLCLARLTQAWTTQRTVGPTIEPLQKSSQLGARLPTSSWSSLLPPSKEPSKRPCNNRKIQTGKHDTPPVFRTFPPTKAKGTTDQPVEANSGGGGGLALGRVMLTQQHHLPQSKGP